MAYIPVLWYIGFKEFFRLFDLPNAQSGSFVDLLLKKYRHKIEIRILKYEI